MGNSALSGYAVTEKNTASGGPGLLWKIHEATTKDSKTPVSVWIIDKKKGVKDKELIGLCKKDASNLAKYRHPYVVQVTKAYQENSEACVLVTEPLFGSLANILKDFRNISKITDELQNFSLEPLEVWVENICTALAFLHESGNVIHGGISPENIFITKTGQWKLGGFQYLCPQSQPTRPSAALPPPLDYTSPELVLNPNPVFDHKADIFSLGCILFRLFTGQRLINVDNDEKRYKHDIKTMFPLNFADMIPPTLTPTLEQMLQNDPAKRPTIRNFLDSAFFKDILVRTLTYLSAIVEKTDESKSQFFKNLPIAIPQFSEKILITKILPQLLMDLRSTLLIPCLLPSIFAIAKQLRNPTFSDVIFPALVKVFTLEEPYHIRLLLLRDLQFLMEYSGKENVEKFVFPMIFSSFSQGLEIVLAVLQVTPIFIDHVTAAQIRSFVLPAIDNLCTSSEVPDQVKIKCLQCYGKILPKLQDNDILEVFATLAKCGTGSANVRAAAVGVCDMLSERLGHIFSAVQLLPFISPFLIDPQMDQRLFPYVLSAFQKILHRIEVERYKELGAHNIPGGPGGSAASLFGSDFERKIHPTHTREAHRKPPLQTRAMKTDKEILKKLNAKKQEQTQQQVPKGAVLGFDVLNFPKNNAQPNHQNGNGNGSKSKIDSFSALSLPTDFPEVKQTPAPAPTPIMPQKAKEPWSSFDTPKTPTIPTKGKDPWLDFEAPTKARTTSTPTLLPSTPAQTPTLLPTTSAQTLTPTQPKSNDLLMDFSMSPFPLTPQQPQQQPLTTSFPSLSPSNSPSKSVGTPAPTVFLTPHSPSPAPSQPSFSPLSPTISHTDPSASSNPSFSHLSSSVQPGPHMTFSQPSTPPPSVVRSTVGLASSSPSSLAPQPQASSFPSLIPTSTQQSSQQPPQISSPTIEPRQQQMLQQRQTEATQQQLQVQAQARAQQQQLQLQQQQQLHLQQQLFLQQQAQSQAQARAAEPQFSQHQSHLVFPQQQHKQSLLSQNQPSLPQSSQQPSLSGWGSPTKTTPAKVLGNFDDTDDWDLPVSAISGSNNQKKGMLDSDESW